MTDKFKAQGRALSALLCTAALALVNPAISAAAPSETANSGSAAVGSAVESTAAANETAVPNANPPFTVEVTRTDNFGANVHVGDVLTFRITYTNKTSANITMVPGETNIDKVKVNGSYGGCRWRDLAPGKSANCNFGTYTVKESDVENGITFTSFWKGTSDRNGNTPVQGGENVSAATLPAAITSVNPAPRPAAPYVPPTLTAADDPASQGLETLEIGQKVELSRANYAGFNCHRIPALTVAPNGDILAAWDGRPSTCTDAPQANSIIQRRSADGGKTWGKPTYIAAGKIPAPKYGYSDPSYVVDREKNKIFAFFVKSFEQGFAHSQAGTEITNRNVLHAAVTESTDNGVNWSEPRVITADINPANGYSRFAASGEGIQIREGAKKGRLVQQYTFRIGSSANYKQQSVSVYSDDHGKTWKAGAPIGTGMDENKVVELAGGKLMLNSRASDGTKARKIAISENGGETWGEVKIDNELIDPNNNASIIRAFPFASANDPKSQVLLFSNARNAGGRSNGTISVSLDNGETWAIKKVFEPGAMQYSTLTPLEYKGKEWAGKYGLLYEGAGNTIVYKMIDLNWLGLRDDLTFERCFLGDQKAAGLTLQTTDLPEQNAAEGRANMTDGNPATIWHSKWNTSIQLPVTIDFTAAGGAVTADKLILRHRTDSENGRFKNFTVKGGVGDQLKTLGTYTNNPNNGEPTVIKLTEPIEKIQIEVSDTYGNNASIKFASLAEIELTKAGYPAGCHKVTVEGGEITSAINAGKVAHEGDNVAVQPIVPEGKKFTGWSTDPANLKLTAAEDGTAKFAMPNSAVKLTANFTDAAPTPEEPKPADPTPADPTPADPTPADPTPADPTPADPTPADPTPADPTPADPTPADPTPADPTPADPDPSTPTDPAADEKPAQPEQPAAPTPDLAPDHTQADQTAGAETTPEKAALAKTGAAISSLTIIALLLAALGTGMAANRRRKN
ncbi:exo-alpha-sialidase [Arcanobacterium hippocoleae]